MNSVNGSFSPLAHGGRWLHSVATSGRLVELNLPTFTVSARMGEVQDIFGRSRVFFENDVIKHTNTLDEAFDLVKTINEDLR